MQPDTPSAAQTSSDSMIDAYRQEIATQTERVVVLEARIERIRTDLWRIVNNAEAHHGDDAAKARALAVIAEWGMEALDV